jgi:HSP20 family protein
MLIKKWNNSSNLFDMMLDNLFDNKLNVVNFNSIPYDIIENDNEYFVEFSLAGIKKEDVKINVENNQLTINAERKEIDDLKYNKKSTFFGKYEKIFTLPENINVDEIKSSLNNGILRITIPKMEIKNGSKVIEIL